MYYQDTAVPGGGGDGTVGGGGMYYPVYNVNNPVYFNAPIIQPVDDKTLKDYIKKQMYVNSSSLACFHILSCVVSTISVMRIYRKISSCVLR